jgi:hypothetical protein
VLNHRAMSWIEWYVLAAVGGVHLLVRDFVRTPRALRIKHSFAKPPSCFSDLRCAS